MSLRINKLGRKPAMTAGRDFDAILRPRTTWQP
jgi:hypothetical protein